MILGGIIGLLVGGIFVTIGIVSTINHGKRKKSWTEVVAETTGSAFRPGTRDFPQGGYRRNIKYSFNGQEIHKENFGTRINNQEYEIGSMLKVWVNPENPNIAAEIDNFVGIFLSCFGGFFFIGGIIWTLIVLF